jgi:predicted nucleic acid-binding protein
MPLVVDASVALSWCFEDEVDRVADTALERLQADQGIVPAIWPYEVANGLRMAEVHGRYSRADLVGAVELLRGLNVEVDVPTLELTLSGVSDIARDFRLTVYDASYLELALRTARPLATLDAELRGAARRAGVELVEP